MSEIRAENFEKNRQAALDRLFAVKAEVAPLFDEVPEQYKDYALIKEAYDALSQMVGELYDKTTSNRNFVPEERDLHFVEKSGGNLLIWMRQAIDPKANFKPES